MYIRTLRRKNKNGTVVEYLQLAHNRRDPQTGNAVAEVLYSFGRADQIDKAALARLVKSLSRFVEEEPSGAASTEFDFEWSRPMGGAWVLDQLWKSLEIDQSLGRLLKERSFEIPVERAIFAMVANKALAPASKLAIEDWVATAICIPDLAEVKVHQLYRSMDFILAAAEKIQEDVFFTVANLLNLEVDLIYFDTTSTYFDIEDEDPSAAGEPFRVRGHSKDSRPDCPQVVIGLAVTKEGIPVRCWVWPGNTADVSVIKQVKKDLNGWKLGRVITVVNRGFVSETNLTTLQQAGGGYIAGEKLRAGKPAVEEALSRAGRYQEINENLHVKEVIIGSGETRKRYILAYNPKQAARDKEAREKSLRHLEEELAAAGGKHSKSVCNLLSHPTCGRYLKTLASGKVTIDKRKVREEERLDGKYLIRTSDDEMPAGAVASGYKQLLEIENAFKCLKTTLELRPIYHRLEERIRAHVLLCWLALLLIRVAENRTDMTWRELRNHLEQIHLGQFSGAQGRFLKRTQLTQQQTEMLHTLGVSEPPLLKKIETTPANL
jgi:hypothetical protein